MWQRNGHGALRLLVQCLLSPPIPKKYGRAEGSEGNPLLRPSNLVSICPIFNALVSLGIPSHWEEVRYRREVDHMVWKDSRSYFYRQSGHGPSSPGLQNRGFWSMVLTKVTPLPPSMGHGATPRVAGCHKGVVGGATGIRKQKPGMLLNTYRAQDSHPNQQITQPKMATLLRSRNAVLKEKKLFPFAPTTLLEGSKA